MKPRIPAEADSQGSAGMLSGRETQTLERLRGELWLIQYVLEVERERVARLAEQWGHRSFALYLRERSASENLSSSD